MVKEMKTTWKILAMLVGLAILLAITSALQSAFGNSLAWTTTGDPFTDWQVYYLDFIPTWIILCAVWITPKPSAFKAMKWILAFFCGYWLFYDWIWWSVEAVAKPGSFSWSMPFYFNIVVPGTPMWFFLMIAIAGFMLSIVLLEKARTWKHLIPFILYLAWIYGIGGIALVIPTLPLIAYEIWSAIFIPVIAIAFIVAFDVISSIRHYRFDINLEFQREESIAMSIGTAVIIYYAVAFTVFDITKGFIISAVNDSSFPALSNVIFIISMYVIFMGFGFFISSGISFRDVHAIEYTLYASILTYIVILVLSAIVGYYTGFGLDVFDWIFLPIILLLWLGNPAQFLLLIAMIFITIESSIDYFKRVEV